MRGRRDTHICNNCRKDKQKCDREPGDDGTGQCIRCRNYGYHNCSTDPKVPPVQRPRRILNDLKCDKCRKDRKSCVFSYGEWPQPCDRCNRAGTQCPKPTRPARVRPRKTGHDDSDCMSTFTPSEYSEHGSEYTEYTDYDYYDYDDPNHWIGEDEAISYSHYSHPMYHAEYNECFSPDSGSSDISSVAGYSDGATSPFAFRL